MAKCPEACPPVNPQAGFYAFAERAAGKKHIFAA
jgi:hypothetical protein